jgi:hypothetical protein
MNEVRIELGFSGGGGVTATVDEAEWDQLKASLDKGEGGWASLTEKDDETLLLSVDKVIYARAKQVNRSVGFAGLS